MNIYLIKGHNAIAAPERATMKALFNELLRLLNGVDKSAVPTVGERVLKLSLALEVADRELRDGMTQAYVTLGNHGLGEIAGKIAEVEAADIPPSAREKGLDALFAMASKQVAWLDAMLRHHADITTEQASAVRSLKLGVKGSTLIADVQLKISQLEARMATAAVENEKLDQNRKVLDDTITQLETHGLNEKVQLPSLEELKAAGVPIPGIEMIEKGVQLLEQLLGKLKGGLKYIELIGERDRLRQQFNERVDARRRDEATLHQNHHVLAQLQAVLVIADKRDEWVTLFDLIPEGLGHYAVAISAEYQHRDMQAVMDQIAHCREFVNQVHGLNRNA